MAQGPAFDELVTFYLPFRSDGVTRLPERMSDYWSWLLQNRHINKGKYSWTLQTYLQLKEAGIPCRLSERFPRSGVVISHRDFLPVFLLPRPDVFLICIKPDRKAHTWAQYYIVQNARDGIFQSGRAATGRQRCRTGRSPTWCRDGGSGRSCAGTWPISGGRSIWRAS